jgi:hypothetical protein
VSGWSVRKRLRGGTDVLLEEQLTGFALAPGESRLRRRDASPERIWPAPTDLYITDACLHPSGAVSAVLLDRSAVAGNRDYAVFVARLSPDLSLLGLSQLHDPEIANDPLPAGLPPPTDVTANSLPRDAARLASDGEEAVLAVTTHFEEVVLYRLAFSSGWQALRRTLAQPVSPKIVLLPTGGSFDTFGAMWSSLRALLDVDEQGNAYVAFSAYGGNIRRHAGFFGVELASIPDDSGFRLESISDVIVASFDRSGKHLWSQVVGTSHEDEPYAVRALRGQVAVVGRSRRFAGDDNTFWDAWVASGPADGTPLSSRTLQLDQSSILLAVDALPEQGWLVAGSDGWAQNPSGLSVFSFGAKLILLIPPDGSDPVRLALPAGPRHNELHSVQADGAHLWFAGHEDGPVMHTGDTDPREIHATGVFGFLTR